MDAHILRWEARLAAERNDLEAAAAKFGAAIDAFASQLTDRGPDTGPVLPAGIVAHFTRAEEMLLR